MYTLLCFDLINKLTRSQFFMEELNNRLSVYILINVMLNIVEELDHNIVTKNIKLESLDRGGFKDRRLNEHSV